MVNDPIADLLTQLRNAYMAGKKTVTLSHSKGKEALAVVLKKEGYIADMSVITEKSKLAKADLKKIAIDLKYTENKPAMETAVRVSTPGRKIYVDKKHIPSVLSGYGTAVISTSKGLMTDTEARKAHIGGKVICYIS